MFDEQTDDLQGFPLVYEEYPEPRGGNFKEGAGSAKLDD